MQPTLAINDVEELMAMMPHVLRASDTEVQEVAKMIHARSVQLEIGAQHYLRDPFAASIPEVGVAITRLVTSSTRPIHASVSYPVTPAISGTRTSYGLVASSS